MSKVYHLLVAQTGCENGTGCVCVDCICSSAAKLCRMLVGCGHPRCVAVQRSRHLARHVRLPQAGDAQLSLGEHQV